MAVVNAGLKQLLSGIKATGAVPPSAALQARVGPGGQLPAYAVNTTRGAGQQLSVAKPPAPRQTPTGGARPTQGAAVPAARTTAPKPLVNGAVRQQVGGTGQATAPRPPAAKTPLGTMGSGRPSGLAPAGTPAKPSGGVTPPTGSTAAGAKGGPPIPGAPPGLPNTTPTVPNPPVTAGANPNPIPLDPTDEAAKMAAQATYNNAQATGNLGMQNAALAYGDPSLMGQWGLPATVNPNSALALAALRAQQQTQRAEDARARAGTFFSSLMGQDVNTIGGAQQRADLAGYQKYQDALAKFGLAMQGAQGTEQSAINAANADERAKALANLPTPDTATGSFAPGNVATPTPRTTGIKTPKTTKGAKAPTPKTKAPPAVKSKTATGLKVPSRKK